MTGLFRRKSKEKAWSALPKGHELKEDKKTEGKKTEGKKTEGKSKRFKIFSKPRKRVRTGLMPSEHKHTISNVEVSGRQVESIKSSHTPRPNSGTMPATWIQDYEVQGLRDRRKQLKKDRVDLEKIKKENREMEKMVSALGRAAPGRNNKDPLTKAHSTYKKTKWVLDKAIKTKRIKF